MKDDKQGRSFSDKVNAAAFAAIVLIGCIHLARYIALGLLLGIVTVLIVETLLVLIGYMAWKGRLPCLFLIISIAGVVLFINMNHLETTMFNIAFLIQAIVAFLGTALGLVFMVREKLSVRCIPYVAGLLTIAMVTTFLTTWIINTNDAKTVQGIDCACFLPVQTYICLPGRADHYAPPKGFALFGRNRIRKWDCCPKCDYKIDVCLQL